ncbi:MAG: hypothetical protein WAZ18_00645 [Alphaproteobacteria bacterium]
MTLQISKEIFTIILVSMDNESIHQLVHGDDNGDYLISRQVLLEAGDVKVFHATETCEGKITRQAVFALLPSNDQDIDYMIEVDTLTESFEDLGNGSGPIVLATTFDGQDVQIDRISDFMGAQETNTVEIFGLKKDAIVDNGTTFGKALIAMAQKSRDIVANLPSREESGDRE